MKDCEYYRELISRLTDDELNSDEYSALSAHMSGCQECSAQYAVFVELARLMREDLPELPEGLHENIMAGVRRSNIVKNNRRRLPVKARYYLAAAACFAVVMLAAVGVAGEISGGGNILRMSSRSAAMEAASVSTGSSQAATSDFSIDEAGAANASVYASMASPNVYYVPDEYLTEEPAEYLPTETVDPYLSTAPTAQPERAPAAAPTPLPTLPAAPIETAAPAEVIAPVETPTPAESTAPIETPTPAESAAPVETPTPAESPVPMEIPAPAESPALMDTKEPEPVAVDMTEGEQLDKLMGLLTGTAAEKDAKSQPTEEVQNVPPAAQDTARAAQGEPEAAQESQELKLPEKRAEKIYTLAVTVDKERYEISVYLYDDAIYYRIPEPLEGAGLHLAKCEAEAVTKLADEYQAKAETSD